MSAAILTTALLVFKCVQKKANNDFTKSYRYGYRWLILDLAYWHQGK